MSRGENDAVQRRHWPDVTLHKTTLRPDCDGRRRPLACLQYFSKTTASETNVAMTVKSIWHNGCEVTDDRDPNAALAAHDALVWLEAQPNGSLCRVGFLLAEARSVFPHEVGDLSIAQ